MAYTPPSATTEFNKITPEKVYINADDPYWLSVNGGTVSGNLTVTGNENVGGNLIVLGSVTAASIAGAISLPATLQTVTTSGVSTTITTANTALVTFANTFPLVSGSKYLVIVPFSLQVTAHTFTGAATSGTLAVNVTLGVNTYPANFVQTFTIAGATGNITSIQGNAVFAITPGANATVAPILSAICLGGLATVVALGSIDGDGGNQVAVIKIAVS
jgi:hypothetical protein